MWRPIDRGGALALGVERPIEIARDVSSQPGLGVAQQRQRLHAGSVGERRWARSASCPSVTCVGKPRCDPRDRFVERDARDRHPGREGIEQAATAWRRRAARRRRDRRRGGSAARTPAPAARGRCGRHRRVPPPASRRAAWSTRRLGPGHALHHHEPQRVPGHVDPVAQAHRCRAARRADRRGRCRPACRCRSDRHAARRAAARRAPAGRRSAHGRRAGAGSR